MVAVFWDNLVERDAVKGNPMSVFGVKGGGRNFLRKS